MTKLSLHSVTDFNALHGIFNVMHLLHVHTGYNSLANLPSKLRGLTQYCKKKTQADQKLVLFEEIQEKI